jgi:hypothetical protein
MNWPTEQQGRRLARLYLVAFMAMLIGVVWTLCNQATSRDGTPVFIGAGLFIVGQLALIALALKLQTGLPEKPGRGPSRYQLAWQRLTLGSELPMALSLARGQGPSSGH